MRKILGFRRGIQFGLGVTTSLLLVACCSIGNKPNNEVTYDLEKVVEAVQYAVDQASTHQAWETSEKELAHWTEFCKSQTVKAAEKCALAREASKPLCNSSCSSSKCSPADKLFCESLLSGDARHELCSSRGDTSSENKDWCNKITDCIAEKSTAEQACSAVKTLTLPKLKKATLSLKIENGGKVGGNINVIVVKFGGESKTSSASTVTLEFMPRIREKAYGSIGPLNVNNRQPSDAAKKLSGDLSDLIVSALIAGTQEIVKSSGNNEMVRPPMSMSAMKIEMALSVTSNGELTIGKEWDTIPASFEVGGGLSHGLTNSLTLEYARPEEKSK